MAISVQCACGARYRVPDSAMGKHARCKMCGDKFAIPLLEKVDEPGPLSELGALPPGAAIEPPRPPAGVSVSATPAVAHGRHGGGGARASAATAQREHARAYFRAVGRAFGFPLRPRNLAPFFVLWFIVCLKIPLMYAGCLGLIGMLIVQAYYFAFCLNTMGDAANGEEDLTQVVLSGSWVDDLIVPAFKFLVSWIAVWAPAAIYLVAVVDLDVWILIAMMFHNSFDPVFADGSSADRTLFLVYYMGGLFFWPILILSIGLGGMPGIFRIDLILRTIVKTFPAYVFTVVLTFAALSIPFVYGWLSLEFLDSSLGLRLALPIMIYGLELYAMIVAMRVIGLYYYYFKDRFAWSWG